MELQAGTVQLDQAATEVARALAATAENIGKSTADLLKHLQTTGEPLTFRINGGEMVVLQNAESYQKLLDELDFAQSQQAVRRALEDVKHGRTKTLQEFAAEMREKYGFPEKRPEMP